MSQHSKAGRLSAAGVLITIGIIFGDIGTSPLYVLKAIMGDAPLDRVVILGGVSCILWTLTLQTTLKYVILTLRADNKGEGGIFALYALVRKMKIGWLIIPAVVGGSALLADGIITPPISIASAIEGLLVLNPEIKTLPIVIALITVLFIIQQFGTKVVGKFFGPVMVTWFLMIGVAGTAALIQFPEILKAVNPMYAWELLYAHPNGFWLLGAVFLCTTGAEALYSDLGHCGKENIRVSWMFVKVSLLLNYFGQGAWLLSNEGSLLQGVNPFYAIIPHGLIPYSIAVATGAAIVASQALISGSFTLVNEAMRLNFWPKVRIYYPTDLKGQLYVPSINWLMWLGCIFVVWHFGESSKMEGAYGLAIILTMLMTTTLLSYYMTLKRYPIYLTIPVILIYYGIEISFFIANLKKFHEGGWITLTIASFLIFVMIVWYFARKIRNRYTDFTLLQEYTGLIQNLSKDAGVGKYATHLVYLTSADNKNEIETKVIYSILQKQPKRADIYWFVHVDLTDEPYTHQYKVKQIVEKNIIRVDFKLGFRVAPRINVMFRQVVQDMVKEKEVDIISRYESLNKSHVIGDFRFVVLEKFLSNENELPIHEKFIMDCYFLLKYMSLSEEKAFGLDTSSVAVEKVPMIIAPAAEIQLDRVY